MQKRVECPLQFRDEPLPQLEKFKYLGILFIIEGRVEWEIDRLVQHLLWMLYQSVVKKTGLEDEVMSFYRSIYYIPTLTYGHKLWVVTKRKTADTSGRNELPQRVFEFTLRDIM